MCVCVCVTLPRDERERGKLLIRPREREGRRECVWGKGLLRFFFFSPLLNGNGICVCVYICSWLEQITWSSFFLSLYHTDGHIRIPPCCIALRRTWEEFSVVDPAGFVRWLWWWTCHTIIWFNLSKGNRRGTTSFCKSSFTIGKVTLEMSAQNYTEGHPINQKIPINPIQVDES